MPTPRVGDDLLDRLRFSLPGISVEEVGRDVLPEPEELGNLAAASHDNTRVLVLRLDRGAAGASAGGSRRVSATELTAKADQLRRARSSGLDEAPITRDYALPYLEALIEAGRIADAERVWACEFRDGQGCSDVDPQARRRCFRAGLGRF